ncbi:MAG: hypothetical protein WC538_03140 [Thermoanaerobaculia bacterium]
MKIADDRLLDEPETGDRVKQAKGERRKAMSRLQGAEGSSMKITDERLPDKAEADDSVRQAKDERR